MQKRIGKHMTARIATTKLGQDILELKLSNTERAAFFTLDNTGETMRIRLRLETALQLAQMIDEAFDMEAGAVR